jgi:hypothetical protein
MILLTTSHPSHHHIHDWPYETIRTLIIDLMYTIWMLCAPIVDHSIIDHSIIDHSIIDHSIIWMLIYYTKSSYDIIHHNKSDWKNWWKYVHWRLCLCMIWLIVAPPSFFIKYLWILTYSHTYNKNYVTH